MGSLDRFVDLARDETEEGRTRLVEAVTDLFFNDNHVPSELEQILFGDIMSTIIDEVAEEVRAFIARRIASKEHIDRTVLLKLAFDKPEIAAPVLKQSPILLEDDLANIAYACSDEHRLAVTQRPYISEKVSEVLADNGNAEVLRSLAANRGAHYSVSGLRKLLERGGRDAMIQMSLCKRAGEESHFSTQLQSSLTEQLRSRLGTFARYIDDGEFEAFVSMAAERYGRAKKDDEQRKHNKAFDLKLLREEKKSIDEIVHDYLSYRNLKTRLFDLLWIVSKQLEINESAVRQLVLKDDLSTFSVLCRATGMSEASFRLFVDFLIHVLDKDRKESVRMLSDFSAISKKACEQTLALIRRQYRH